MKWKKHASIKSRFQQLKYFAPSTLYKAYLTCMQLVVIYKSLTMIVKSLQTVININIFGISMTRMIFLAFHFEALQSKCERF